MGAPWAKDPETIEHRSFDAHFLQRCRTHGAAPIESRNGDMRFASTNSLNLCYLRFLLFKIFPVFRMRNPQAKDPETIEHRSFDVHVLQRCRTYGASTLDSCSTKMPHLRCFNAWFIFYKDAAPAALHRLSQEMRTFTSRGNLSLQKKPSPLWQGRYHPRLNEITARQF